MKKTVITILLFIYLAGFGQDSTAVKGFYFGPSVTSVISNGYYYKSQGFYNYNYNRSYYLKYYFLGAGPEIMYSFNRNLSLTFGFQYCRLSTANEYYYQKDSVSNPWKIYKTYQKKTADFLNLPVHMDWCLFRGKISPVFISGLMPQIYFGGKSFNRTTYENGLIQTSNHVEEPIQRFYFFYQFGLGIDVNFKNSRVRFLIYNLSGDIYRSKPFQYFNYSLHGGISYYFKN